MEGWLQYEYDLHLEDHPPVAGKKGYRTIPIVGDEFSDGEHIDIPLDTSNLIRKNS